MKLIIPAPANTRETLTSFLMYDARLGVSSVIGRMDFSGVGRTQVIASTIGHVPERLKRAVEPANFGARGAMAKWLTSGEFQLRIRETVLEAFPEKRRVVFVHNPKCAGSDLQQTLRRKYPLMHQAIALQTTPASDMFEQLRLLITGLQFSNAIAVTGHTPLVWYQERKLLRSEDELFTTVRDPRDRIFSHLSYVLQMLIDFREAPRPDTTGWLAAIGLDAIKPDLSAAALVDLGRQLLRAPGVTPRDAQCVALGRGTAASAIETMAETDIEVTDMERYSAWRLARFGTDSAVRVNRSRPLFTPEMADTADESFIDGLIEEDRILYDAVSRQLAATNSLSIRGGRLGS